MNDRKAGLQATGDWLFFLRSVRTFTPCGTKVLIEMAGYLMNL